MKTHQSATSSRAPLNTLPTPESCPNCWGYSEWNHSFTKQLRRLEQSMGTDGFVRRFMKNY
ncbi:MAG: hypothetical protein AAFQ02_12450, partial [Bacteroidota bacterium]